MFPMMISTMIFAGGDITPVEPVIETPVVEESTSGSFYLGLAYGYMTEAYTRTPDLSNPRSFDEDLNTIMLQAGYVFNPYVAIEGRYWFGGLDDLNVVNENGQSYVLAGPDAWGVYAKPMYPIAEALNIYGLLGYAAVNHSTIKLNDVNGFSWGLGASYDITENIAVFADYISIYNDDKDLPGGVINKAYEIDTINVGISYNF